MATDIAEVYAGADASIVLTLLTQKIIRTVLDDSIQEARLV
jgi:hypothetical protein